MKKKLPYFYLLAFMGGLGFVAFSFVGTISPEELTWTRMNVTEYRTIDYFASHQALPPNLKKLPLRSGYDNSIHDGWGRETIYESNGSEVTLTSYGGDGVAGGVDDSADIIRKFSVEE